MKKVILLISVFGLLLSCNKSNEEKAKALVKEYIVKNANDPDSYESVEWGTLDSTYIVKYTEEFKKNSELMSKARDEYEIARLENLNYTMLLNKEKYGKGWVIYHKFRGKNGYGAKMLADSKFYLDSALTKVVGQEIEK